MATEQDSVQNILSSLHKVILSWDFYRDVLDDRTNHNDMYMDALKKSDKLQKVPNKFTSAEHYVESYETLFMVETRSSIDRARLLEMSDPERCRVRSTQIKGEFVVIDLTLTSPTHGSSVRFMSGDLILLSQGDDPRKQHDVHVIGIVDQSTGESVSIRIYLDDPARSPNSSAAAIAASATSLPHNSGRLLQVANALRQLSDPVWYLTRVMNLSTLHREYMALKAVPTLPLADEIIYGAADDSGEAKQGPRATYGKDSFNPSTQTSGVESNSRLVMPSALRKALVEKFNPSQMEAVERSLMVKGIALVQGPPGTGKTSTIMGILSALLNARVEVGASVMGGKGRKSAGNSRSTSRATSRQVSDAETELSEEEVIKQPGYKRKVGKKKAETVNWFDDSDDEDEDDEEDEMVEDEEDAPVARREAESPEGKFISNLRHYRKAQPWFSQAHYETWMDVEGLSIERTTGQAKRPLAKPREPIVLHKEVDSVKPRKILICAPSNAAVDELMRRVASGGCMDARGGSTLPPMVRIGPNVHPQLQKYSLETITALRLRSKSDAGADRREEIKTQILKEARIVASTLASCGSKDFSLLAGELDTVIIDEASQGIELSTLIALRLGCKRLILVGDPRQLPATVFSKTATDYGYDRSLFQRLEALGKKVTMLSIQYRMHPALSAFPSKRFYGGQLLDAENILDLVPAAQHHTLPTFAPFVFYHLESVEASGATGSVSNPEEAKFIVQLVKVLSLLFPAIDWRHEVGIVTPYADQVGLIRKELRAAFGVDQSHPCPFEVGTVDGFQGREKGTIIFSAVRAHPESDALGFVTDKRRLNVAITRARRNLFVVGHAHKLMKNCEWHALITHAEKTKSFIRVSDPPGNFVPRFLRGWLKRNPTAWRPAHPLLDEHKALSLEDITAAGIANKAAPKTVAKPTAAAVEEEIEDIDVLMDLQRAMEIAQQQEKEQALGTSSLAKNLQERAVEARALAMADQEDEQEASLMLLEEGADVAMME